MAAATSFLGSKQLNLPDTYGPLNEAQTGATLGIISDLFQKITNPTSVQDWEKTVTSCMNWEGMFLDNKPTGLLPLVPFYQLMSKTVDRHKTIFFNYNYAKAQFLKQKELDHNNSELAKETQSIAARKNELSFQIGLLGFAEVILLCISQVSSRLYGAHKNAKIVANIASAIFLFLLPVIAWRVINRIRGPFNDRYQKSSFDPSTHPYNVQAPLSLEEAVPFARILEDDSQAKLWTDAINEIYEIFKKATA